MITIKTCNMHVNKEELILKQNIVTNKNYNRHKKKLQLHNNEYKWQQTQKQRGIATSVITWRTETG